MSAKEEADTADAAAEEEQETGTAEAAAGGDGGSGDAGEAEDEEVPEIMELCDAAEEAGEDAAALLRVVRLVGRRLRLSPDDRDLLCDFEGISHICKALSAAPHEWRGEAMLAFCRIAPDVCRTSNVNRGSLRDEGFVAAAVGLLRWATEGGDEAAALAACTALTATCTANDGNKRAAAQLPGAAAGAEGAEEAAGEAAGEGAESGLIALLNALSRFPESLALQAEGISAIRALLTDDDPRKADVEPAALANREVATSDAGFPFFGAAVERAFALLDSTEQPQVKLREQALLLLRELSRRQDFVQPLAFGAKFLGRAVEATSAEDARVARAGLAVLRNFAVNEEVRDELALMSDGAQKCAKAVARHLSTAAVCEQGFGLFTNMTMRKSPVVGAIAGGDPSLVALGHGALRAHAASRPDVARVVVHTLRNLAAHEESAAKEVKESGVFEEVRKIVQDHEPEPRWRAAVDISRQLLREFRADEGMEKKAQYNQFY